MGVVLLAMAIVVIIAEPLSFVFKQLSLDQWGAMLSQWQGFIPVVVGTGGGLIAGTAFTEPKKKDNDGNNG